MNENVQHFDLDPRCSGHYPKLGCILYVLSLLYNVAVYMQRPLAAAAAAAAGKYDPVGGLRLYNVNDYARPHSGERLRRRCADLKESVGISHDVRGAAEEAGVRLQI